MSGHPELGQDQEGGYDCSGFVRQVIMRSGLYIPDYIAMDNSRRQMRHVNELWDHYGTMVIHSPEPGDLIFFSRNGLIPTHVGIVWDEESYIHSPGSDDSRVAIAAIKKSIIKTSPATGRRLYDKNPIGFKAPTIPLAEANYRHHQELA